MRIEILDEAEEDLINGFEFYERLDFMPAFTLFISVTIDFLPSGFPSLSIIGFKTRLFGSMQYSIADETLPGFVSA